MKEVYGSDVIIEILAQHNIDYVSLNPGATFRGLHDSLVNADLVNKPKMLLCCHEEIAVAIAHGYAKASGKMMAVFIHANIGLQHASMAIFNAWCDRVPMLVLCGIGPLSTDERRPWIDWIHTSQHQNSIIEGYVKWHDQPKNFASTVESLYRACKISNTQPTAPVYLGIDAAIQEERLEEKVVLKDIDRYLPLKACGGDAKTISVLANCLMKAKNPLIIVDHLGGNASVTESLICLVECLNIPVIDCGSRYNFPNDHEYCLTELPDQYFQEIDFILAFEVRDLSGVLYQKTLSTDLKIAHVSLSDYLISTWVSDFYPLFPVDYPIAADSHELLPALLSACQTEIGEIPQYIRDRKAYWSSVHQTLRRDWLDKALTQDAEIPMAMPFVVYQIYQIIKREDFVLTNDAGVVVGKWVRRLWQLNRPGCHIGNSGGAGLGYGLGASIGAAIAYKNTDKICINLQADGDFLFTPSALWTAAHYEAPLLIIVMNNRTYQNTKEHAIKVADVRNRSARNAGIGNDFDSPAVDFTKLAESFGIKSFPVISAPDTLASVLSNALNYLKDDRKPVLIEIIIK